MELDRRGMMFHKDRHFIFLRQYVLYKFGSNPCKDALFQLTSVLCDEAVFTGIYYVAKENKRFAEPTYIITVLLKLFAETLYMVHFYTIVAMNTTIQSVLSNYLHLSLGKC